jgi:hypothetical protein
MEVVWWIAVVIIAVPLVLMLLFVRRHFIARGGTIEVSLRLTSYVDGRGWSPGIARFVGDELHWYRVFSFAPRPRRIFKRRSFIVVQRRRPDGAEQRSLPGQTVVLSCRNERELVEIAMAETTVTGFLSWLEAGPPGAASSRFAAR